MSETIAEKLINIGSVQFSFKNHFTLTSGLKSPVYVDCRKIISFVDERNFIMDESINYFKEHNLQFDFLAGGETAGIPYAAIISEKMKKFEFFKMPRLLFHIVTKINFQNARRTLKLIKVGH